MTATQGPRTAARLTYDRRGEGPPLLLVHGLGSARTVWRPLVDRLARRFDTIAVDLPGHGDSPALPHTEPATPRRLALRVERLLDALGLDRVDVVGNSLGGWVSLEIAADGRARSVTALAPAGLNHRPMLSQPRVLRQGRIAAWAAAPIAPTLLRSRAVRAVGFRSTSAAPGAIPYDDAVESVRRHAAAPGYPAALDGILGGQFTRADQIGADVAVTIVRGDRDYVLPERNHENHALAPDHALWVRLPRCGHVPQWDAPGAVARLVVQTAARAGDPR